MKCLTILKSMIDLFPEIGYIRIEIIENSHVIMNELTTVFSTDQATRYQYRKDKKFWQFWR